MSVYKNDNPAFLNQALNSIYIDQTVKPDEIVIVIDGPVSDELRKIINDFKKQTNIVKIVDLITNRGLGEALRIGSTHCSGDYIVRMDSDDLSHPNRFEKQFSYINNHPELDVLGCNILEFSQSTDEKMRRRACPEYHKDIVKMSKKRSPMNHITACIKRDSLFSSGGYKQMLFAEDYYLWVRMINHSCHFYNIQEDLVYVRVGNGMTARRSNLTLLRSLRSIYKYLLDNKNINILEYSLNIAKAELFIRSPIQVKNFAYKFLLRK